MINTSVVEVAAGIGCLKDHGLIPLAALHPRHSTRNGPSSGPPAATGVTWSAVRSADGCAGRCQPGHHGPYALIHSATTRARRVRSAEVLDRLHRWQREPEAMSWPQPKQGRVVTSTSPVRWKGRE